MSASDYVVLLRNTLCKIEVKGEENLNLLLGAIQGCDKIKELLNETSQDM